MNVVVGHLLDMLVDEVVRDERVVALYQSVVGKDILTRAGKAAMGSSIEAGWGRGILTGREAVSLFVDEVLSCLLRSRFEGAGEGQSGPWESFWGNLQDYQSSAKAD